MYFAINPTENGAGAIQYSSGEVEVFLYNVDRDSLVRTIEKAIHKERMDLKIQGYPFVKAFVKEVKCKRSKKEVKEFQFRQGIYYERALAIFAAFKIPVESISRLEIKEAITTSKKLSSLKTVVRIRRTAEKLFPQFYPCADNYGIRIGVPLIILSLANKRKYGKLFNP